MTEPLETRLGQLETLLKDALARIVVLEQTTVRKEPTPMVVSARELYCDIEGCDGSKGIRVKPFATLQALQTHKEQGSACRRNQTWCSECCKWLRFGYDLDLVNDHVRNKCRPLKPKLVIDKVPAVTAPVTAGTLRAEPIVLTVSPQDEEEPQSQREEVDEEILEYLAKIKRLTDFRYNSPEYAKESVRLFVDTQLQEQKKALNERKRFLGS